jgi:Fe-S cluster assembly protein SufD
MIMQVSNLPGMSLPETGGELTGGSETALETARTSGTTKVDRGAYLATLLALRSPLPSSPDSPASIQVLQSLRDRATARVQELAIPSTRDEDWRFTDLSALLQLNLQAPTAPAALSFEHLQPYLLPAVPNRLVFVDGYFAADLSAMDDLPEGVLVGNLQAGLEFVPILVDYLAQQPGGEEVFTALNTASLTDGALVWIPSGQMVAQSIHLLFVTTGTAPLLVQPRSVVVAGMGSQATLIEDYVTLHEAPYCTNAVTEVWVGANAQVHHSRIQRESPTAFHIGKTAVSQGRDARYTGITVNLGGQVSRHHWEVYQTGEQTTTTLNGLTLVTGDRVADTHSLVAFNHPHGTCDQVNKCIVGDRAHGVFNGKIFVPKPAQLTNAAQLSRNLLLSPKARVDTKPQLEITADNVKCAHGATVSQLEDDAVFYLQSRGIAPERARQLLVYAFAYEVIDQLPIDSLKQTLAQQVAQSL